MGRNTVKKLLEQPTMYKHIPDIFGKRVLEIGCGYGKNCRYFAENGAVKVVGTDISRKTIQTAKRKSLGQPITYRLTEPEKVVEIGEKFDVIYSSSVFQYVEHFHTFIAELKELLCKDGILLFSQRHPMITAAVDRKSEWNYNEQGKEISYAVSDYHRTGKRGSNWFIDEEIIYHRTMGEIVTTLGQNGFCVEVADETKPTPFLLKQYPQLEREMLRPAFLIIRARKI